MRVNEARSDASERWVGRLRFNDQLETVLASDLSQPAVARSAWRQLVDLAARSRGPADPRILGTLTRLRGSVPVAVRLASARQLRGATPPAALVAALAEDTPPVAQEVVRGIVQSGDAWRALIPRLSPQARATLRARRDLPIEATQALASFGPIDLVIEAPRAVDAFADQASDVPKRSDVRPASADDYAAEGEPAAAAAHLADPAVELGTGAGTSATGGALAPASGAPPEGDAAMPSDGAAPGAGEPAPGGAFVTIGAAARANPAVARAIEAAAPPHEATGADPLPRDGTFRIADVVARIEAFRTRRAAGADEEASPATPHSARRSAGFRFIVTQAGEIDAAEGGAAALACGISLARPARPGEPGVDGIAAGAFRRRAPFEDAHLLLGGASADGGLWLVRGVPRFDDASGRFTGYHCIARRPERHEAVGQTVPSADAMRQLVHELRTPLGAIAGFSEMISAQLLGPVDDRYRTQAGAMAGDAHGLLAAIEDADMAARLSSGQVAATPVPISLATVLRAAADEVAPVLATRGATIDLPGADGEVFVDRALAQRLVARLFSVLAGAAGEGERIGVRLYAREGAAEAMIAVDRPRALAAHPGESILAIDEEAADAPLLGAGFALRLVRQLAHQLGGRFDLGGGALTLRLPTALDRDMGQARNR